MALIRCLLFLLLPAVAAAQGVSVHDDAGRTVTLPQPAQRIISLAPSITDMLLGLGARAQIAGVVDDHETPGAWQRSLNLSNAVAVTVYEAWRQNGFGPAG